MKVARVRQPPASKPTAAAPRFNVRSSVQSSIGLLGGTCATSSISLSLFASRSGRRPTRDRGHVRSRSRARPMTCASWSKPGCAPSRRAAPRSRSASCRPRAGCTCSRRTSTAACASASFPMHRARACWSRAGSPMTHPVPSPAIDGRAPVRAGVPSRTPVAAPRRGTRSRRPRGDSRHRCHPAWSSPASAMPPRDGLRSPLGRRGSRSGSRSLGSCGDGDDGGIRAEVDILTRGKWSFGAAASASLAQRGSAGCDLSGGD